MQESVGQEIIKRCKSNGVNFFENNEIKSIRSEGYIEENNIKNNHCNRALGLFISQAK